MNKKTIIGTILAMALILTGTGYAYWTDSLKVTTKATTGDMEVTFVDLGLYAQYSEDELNYGTKGWSIIDGVGDAGYTHSEFFRRNTNYNITERVGSKDEYYNLAKGYNSVNFNAEMTGTVSPIPTTVGPYFQGQVNGSHEIELTVNNMYPGYAQAFRSDILNIGSIAARLSDIKFDVKGVGTDPLNTTASDMLGVAILVEREHQVAGENHVSVFELCKASGMSSSDFFTVGNVDFMRLSALENITPEIYAEAADLLAFPNGNSMDLFIGIAMDPDADGVYTTGSVKDMKANDDKLSQDTGATLVIDLLWDQFNEGKTVDAENILIEQNR